MSIKTFLVAGAGIACFSASALAADLPGRKSAPAAPAASATCLETNALPTDVFGFTVGSDVTDVGAWGGSVTVNGSFGARLGPRSHRFTSVTGFAQVATGLFRCFEVAPYAFVGGTSTRNSLGVKGDATIYGGGVEMKYKILGRDVHGVGATVDLDISGGGGRFKGLLGTGSDSQTTVAARLFLDRELVGGRLYGALNLEHISSFSNRAGALVDASQMNIRGALAAKVLPNLYLGAEAWYSRSYSGSSYDRFIGDGFFVGPNLLWAINDKWTFNAAYQVQVAGSLKGAPGNLNLAAYNQHYARAKLGYAF